MNLELVKEQIKSEIKVDKAGKGTASIRATARLCDVSHTTLNKAFDGGNLNPGKLAGMLIQQGFNPETFLESGTPDLAVAVVVKYYAYSEYSGARCTEQARLVDLAFSGVGARSWMREIAGWRENRVIEISPQDKPTYVVAREIAEQVAWIESNISDKNISTTLIQHAMSSINPVLLPLPQQEQAPTTAKTKNGKKKPETETKPDYFLPTGNYQPLESFFINQCLPIAIEATKSAIGFEKFFSKHVRLMSVIGCDALIPWYKDCPAMRESLALVLLECGFDPDELLVKPW